jgi:hypothetical protein
MAKTADYQRLYRRRRRGVGAGAPKIDLNGGVLEPPPPASGKTTTAFGQNPTNKYEFRYRVVSLDEVIPSNTDSGAVNPDYDSTLQPRDRSRAASQRQIDQTARNFVPEATLVDFHQVDKGSPIIGDDLMVESGNGRTLAMRRMRQAYPEQWEEYQATLPDYAESYGIDPDELRQVKDPILVRERISDTDRADFAREANESAVLRMSTQEQAMQDRTLLSDSALQNFEVREESIDQSLRRASNREFVQKFTAQLNENERAEIMRKDGTLNRQGIWRMKAAMIARVFPGESGARVAETFTESLDSNVRNFERGIGGAMPALLRAEGQISGGARPKKLDMTEDFAASMDMLARLRENGIKTEDYLAQASLFERETTPTQDRLLRHFDSIGRSSKQIREFFIGYSEAVNAADNPNQMALFSGGGGGPLSKEDILDRLGVK